MYAPREHCGMESSPMGGIIEPIETITRAKSQLAHVPANQGLTEKPRTFNGQTENCWLIIKQTGSEGPPTSHKKYRRHTKTQRIKHTHFRFSSTRSLSLSLAPYLFNFNFLFIWRSLRCFDPLSRLLNNTRLLHCRLPLFIKILRLRALSLSLSRCLKISNSLSLFW